MLSQQDQKAILAVKIIPNSKNNEIVGWQGEELKIRIAAPPDKGKANKEMIKFLAAQLNIKNNDIEIIKGSTSSRKKILIRGVDIKNLKLITAKWDPVLLKK